MTKLKEIADFLEAHAPLEFQEDYDNSGLIYGDPGKQISNVLISLDLTEEVLNEAEELGCELVISHHPIIFRGIKKFHGHYVDRIVVKAIKKDIAIYAIHTNLDNVLLDGVNSRIAHRIGLNEVEILQPKKNLSYSFEIGSGVIGYLPKKQRTEDFLQHLKDAMELSVIKHTPLTKKWISKVALCGGSGSFLTDAAIEKQADIFISADFKYHDFFEADGKIIIADIGHYESERFTINLLHDLLIKNFSNFAAHYTKVVTNPIKYY